MKSFQIHTWVLATAAVAGVAGLLLKLTDYGGAGEAAKPAVDAAAARPVASGARVAAPAHDGGGDAHPGVPAPSADATGARHDEATAFAPTVGRFDPAPAAVVPRPVEKRAGGAQRHPSSRRRTARATAAGVEVATAGTAATDSLGGAPRDASPAAGAVAAQAPDPAASADEPGQLPRDAAYVSGDTELFSTDTPVEVPDVGKIAGRRGSMSLWLQPQWAEGNHDDAALVQLGDNLQLVKNVSFLRFELAEDAGAGGVGFSIADWKAGEWHQVTATWHGNEMALYIDGQLASTTTRPVPVELPPETTLRIGSNFPASRPIAPAVIGRVDLRTRPLAPAEIARAYDAAVGARTTRQ